MILSNQNQLKKLANDVENKFTTKYTNATIFFAKIKLTFYMLFFATQRKMLIGVSKKYLQLKRDSKKSVTAQKDIIGK